MHPHIHARSTPDKPAFVMAGSGATMTYRELEDASNRFAQLLRASGLKAGDHIAILLENHPRYFELCFGAHRAGIIYTAMSTRLTLGEAAYIVQNCEARLIVTSRAMADLAARLLPQTPGVALRLMIDGVAPGHQSYEAAVAAMPALRIADETAGGDMLYSSGTTGRPKGVWAPPDVPQIDATNPLINISQNLYRMGPDTVYLSPAPLYHAAPLRWCLTTMRLGGTCVVMEHFDAEDFLRLVEKHRITHTQLVPTMFVRMLKLPAEARRRYDLSSLAIAIHAAAPCPIP
ncbi:MAG: AMP-binding protein, partial [Burkholderiales bacterium]